MFLKNTNVSGLFPFFSVRKKGQRLKLLNYKCHVSLTVFPFNIHSNILLLLCFSQKGNTPRIQALKAQDKELAKYLEST